MEAMFRHKTQALDQVHTLPLALREEMAKQGWGISLPRVMQSFCSADGTERYLIAGDDGQTVETVWMPEGDGGEQGDGSEAETDHAPRPGSQRATICVSSQVGCAVNCRFCLTARLGLGCLSAEVPGR